MSNKIQARCRPNRFAVWYIRHLEEVLKTQYFALKDLDQKIKQNKEAFEFYQKFPTTFLEEEDYQIIPNTSFEINPTTFFENKKIALERAKSIIYSSYQGHCNLVKEYKSKLCIC